eukprot:8499715-Heterocapsa_arctica.AAC.1
MERMGGPGAEEITKVQFVEYFVRLNVIAEAKEFRGEHRWRRQADQLADPWDRHDHRHDDLHCWQHGQDHDPHGLRDGQDHDAH